MRDLVISLLLPFILAVSDFKVPSIPKDANDLQSIEGRKWDMQEIRFLQDNIAYYYNRQSRLENNMNFDNDYILFEHDGTGIYHQSDNTVYKLVWNYTENKQKSLWFKIFDFRNNSDLMVNWENIDVSESIIKWENIDVSESIIKYTEYYTHSTGIKSLGCGIRTSKDSACQKNQLLLASHL